ncbi:N-acetyltransferase family protein [Streptomyces sp. NPDC055189]
MTVAAAPHTGSDLDITAVHSRSDLAAFVELPYQLHCERSHWVPPLRSEQRALLNPRKNPFFDYGQAELFLARRCGRPVGRIAAVNNPHSNAHHATREGFFGLFESTDDRSVGEALFTAAEGWLRERGLETMLGPVGFTTNDECGMLVEGFDERPAVMLPYNPPYYPALLESLGFSQAKDLLAHQFPTTLHEDRGLQRAAQYITRNAALTVRPANLRRFAQETELIRELYNSALGDNWGFSPASQSEFAALGHRLKPVLRAEYALIGEVNGRPAGFAILVPDLAPALAAADGRLFSYGAPLGLLRLLRARRQLTRARLPAMGVRKEDRGQGLELLMYLALSRAAQAQGLHTAEASWVLEDNHQINHVMKRIGGRMVKRYRLYTRPVDTPWPQSAVQSRTREEITH